MTPSWKGVEDYNKTYIDHYYVIFALKNHTAMNGILIL